MRASGAIIIMFASLGELLLMKCIKCENFCNIALRIRSIVLLISQGGLGLLNYKILIVGVPVVVEWLMNPTANHEVVDLIPGLTQWVKDLVLLWAVVWVADAVRILCCGGSGVGQWLQLRFGTSICCGCGPRKGQKKKKNSDSDLCMFETLLFSAFEYRLHYLCLWIPSATFVLLNIDQYIQNLSVW